GDASVERSLARHFGPALSVRRHHRGAAPAFWGGAATVEALHDGLSSVRGPDASISGRGESLSRAAGPAQTGQFCTVLAGHCDLRSGFGATACPTAAGRRARLGTQKGDCRSVKRLLLCLHVSGFRGRISPSLLSSQSPREARGRSIG